MRTKSLHVLVNAPPRNHEWDTGAETQNSALTLAKPKEVVAGMGASGNDAGAKGPKARIMYHYNAEESLAIWTEAMSFQQTSV